MPKDEDLQYAVWNNWHSYGLVVRVGNALQVTRVVPPKNADGSDGEITFEEVWKALKDSIEYERILHLRHTTSGTTTVENCHPFDVLYVPKTKKQVLFMHNGTMNEYKSKIIVDGVTKDDDSGPSDTQNYVNQILIPIISGSNFGNGVGDVSNPLLRKIIDKLWPYGNRGILIANDQPPLLLGDWKKWGDDQLQVSNDDYFKMVKRGPEKARREAKEAEERKKSEAASHNPKLFHNLKDYNFETKHGFYKLSESPCNLLNDWEFYDRDHCVSVGFFKRAELEEVYKDKTGCIALMEWAFADYALLYKEHKELEEKHDKATKRIASMVEELRGHGQKKKVG